MTVLANKVVIKNIKLSSWAYNTQKFWFMLRSVCVESFISILHLYEKISGVRFCSFRDHFKKYFFSFRDQGINLEFWAVFMYKSLLKANKNVKVIYKDNLSVIKSAFEI